MSVLDRQKWQLRFNNLTGMFRKPTGTGMSMGIRLYVFLIMLILLMVLGIVAALLLTGHLSTDRKAAERYASKELTDIHRKVTAQYGDTVNHLVSLSQSLSKNIENQLSNKNIPINRLQEHSWVLEEIIGNELTTLQIALERANCSGVFLVLDATINPTLPQAENSKAGLYLRIPEPRISVIAGTGWFYFRGFPQIAYQNNLNLQSVWKMEFNVENRDFYQKIMEDNEFTTLPLSKRYYWSMENIIPELHEAVLVCSIPLIDSSNAVFGVCGFEITNWNFKTLHTPDDGGYCDVFCLLGTLDDTTLTQENALFSGQSRSSDSSTPLQISEGKGLNRYKPEGGKEYMGLHREIRMYPTGSPYADQRFAVSILISKSEIDGIMYRNNLTLALICALIALVAICISLLVSGKYLSPIKKALEAITSDNLETLTKTNITEIDALIERIKELRSKDRPIPDDLFEDFIARIKTLTPAEMNVFRCHIEGMNNAEIQSSLFISMSTVKAHNSRIYAKLGIASKDELMLYVELIKKSGMAEKIIPQ